MAKKVKAYIKLQIEAAKANPSPPIGPALGQQGVNIMEFCKQFNAVTAQNTGDILPVIITVYSDRSFTFIIKTPPTAFLILKAAGLSSGSGRPNSEKVGKISLALVKEIALKKLPDLNAGSIDAAVRTVLGTARSIGVEVIEE